MPPTDSHIISTPASNSVLPDHLVIRHQTKLGHRLFTVSDGSTVIWTAQASLIVIHEFMQVYQGESTEQLLFSVRASNTDVMNVMYTVVNSQGQTLAIISRNRVQSMVKKQWNITNASGSALATIEESSLNTLLGHLIAKVPQSFVCKINDQIVCNYKETFAFFSNFPKINVNFTPGGNFDKTVGTLAGLIIIATRYNTQKGNLV